MSGVDCINYGDRLLADKKLVANEHKERQSPRHVLITKRDEYDTISDALTTVIQEQLGIMNVTAKVYQEYELAGWLTNDEWQQSLPTIFGDAPLDDIYDCGEADYHKILTTNHKYLRITTVDGQYNAREDATKQCLMQFDNFNTDTPLRSSKVITFTGDITDEQLKKIEQFLINPLEEKTLDITNRSLLRNINTPQDVAVISWFIDPKQWNNNPEHKQIYQENLIKDYKLAMSVEDLECVMQYFQNDEKRDPTITELKVIDNYRSDHCRHTTFNTEICKVVFAKEGWLFAHIKQSEHSYQEAKKSLGREDKPNTLMELAQMPMRYLKANPELNPNIKNIVVSEENNACEFSTIVEMEDGTTEEWFISFKNETHNHPTELSPFGGAATCIGGCIRDPLSNRAWVFQAMRVTGSSDPTQPVSETMAAKLAQRVISQLAARWFAAYGNQIGLAAGQVREYFNPWYVAKRFEVGYVIGGTPAKNVVKRTPKAGDKVILIGWRTGRDAVGAAWGSSKTHDQTSITTAGTEVQRGNPVEERKLTKLFLDPRFARLVKKCNDGGAGGISVMIGELARWLNIDLDKVPLKYLGLDGTEIALAESQERMAIVIDTDDYEEVMALIKEYNLEWTFVAEVTDNQADPSQDRLTMKRKGKDIINVSRDFLDQAGAARKMDEITIDGKEQTDFFTRLPEQVQKTPWAKEKFLANLARKEVASQKWLQAIFDSSVGKSMVLAPYGGKYQTTPQVGMISRIPTYNGVEALTTAISTHGFSPELADESTYLQGIYSILLTISKQVALGGDYEKSRLTLQEYFGKLEKDAERRGHPYSALLGVREALSQLRLASIGGKDSMSGTYKTGDKTIHVPDSVVAFAANTGHIDRVVSAEFKKAGNRVVHISIPKNDLGMPDMLAYRKQMQSVQELIGKGVIRSANVVEEGWYAAAITKMCTGNKIGFAFDKAHSSDEFLYTNQLGDIILEIDAIYAGVLPGPMIGRTTSEQNIILSTNDMHQDNDSISIADKTIIPLDEAQQTREWPLSSVFPYSKGWDKVSPIPIAPDAQERMSTNLTVKKLWNIIGDALNINILKTKPKILIPIFPGTNSELDTAHRIRQNGMEPILYTIRNLTHQDLNESAREFAYLVKQIEGMILAGGFSAGDEPDGSGKFIASFLRIPIVRDAINNNYLSKKSKLTLGICNGFQGLIKTGIFRNGYIEDHLTDDDVTLTHNKNMRHITDVVWLQITSTLSPMLEYVNIGDTFKIPASHGEGNLVGKQNTIKNLINEWFVWAQYLDADGNPTAEYNGSTNGIGGIMDPSTLSVGLMPHPERADGKLFQNIPGNKHLPIFQGMAHAFGVNDYKRHAYKGMKSYFESKEYQAY